MKAKKIEPGSIGAALFDLDGVIVDTEPSYSVFWSAIGRKYGVPGADFADRIKGTTLTLILESNFPAILHPEIVAQLDDYERNMQYILFKGACEYLETLKAAEVPCAIVTSSNLEKMACLWRQHPALRGYFAAVITDEDVTHSKPDPEPYLIAAERLGVTPGDCWVYEDSYNGLESGRRAGAHLVAIATTNPCDTLEDKAEIVVDTLADLL